MSYSGKLELKLKARDLRKKGLAIKEIQKKLKVSISSVSLWVRDVELTKKQLEKLYLNKKTGNLRGSIIAARNKIKQREEITKKLNKLGEKDIGILTKRDKFIAGAALYFAEGGKTDRDLTFSNSDPRAIKFMIDWFREFCKIPNGKFRGSLYIHDNLDRKKAEKFWSNLTGIPLNQFTKTYIVKNNTKRLRKVKHIFGVFRISISDASLHRRVIGQINGLFK